MKKDIADYQLKQAEIQALQSNTELEQQLKAAEIDKKRAEIKQIANNIVMQRKAVIDKFVRGDTEKAA